MLDKTEPDSEDEARSFLLRNFIKDAYSHSESSPSIKLLERWELHSMLDQLHSPSSKHKSKAKLVPTSYNRDTQVLQIGDCEVSYKTAAHAASILGIVFSGSRNLAKRWTFASFYKKYETKLNDDGIKDNTQVRTAVSTVNNMVARQTDYKYVDIFSIDNGFGVSPKYRPKKQR